MRSSLASFPSWLTLWMATRGFVLWGAADLRNLTTPQDEKGCGFPFAISLAFPMDPQIMASLRDGPNQAYADEYPRVNLLIERLSEELAAEIRKRGGRARPLAASERTDPVGIRGDFPHKTAATFAGLGWVGRHCQLVTRDFGPWVRLGTVFTDMPFPCGPPVEQGRCGRCHLCVEACPAKALTGVEWHPGMPREGILDARACDEWKKEHWGRFNNGHICGICTAVCPYGVKYLRKSKNR